ncbi:hypothetical protein J6590_003328 [Homalodisca vitripennis]|nr:hypothetical protein J6590_003328 [Homalodisca vitripennis]
MQSEETHSPNKNADRSATSLPAPITTTTTTTPTTTTVPRISRCPRENSGLTYHHLRCGDGPASQGPLP